MVPPRITRVMDKLTAAWAATPNVSFGQLVESIENLAWERHERETTRTFSARLMNLDDARLEAAIDEWVKIPLELRKLVKP